MSNNIIFHAQLKSKHGTGAARALRDKGMIPAVIYGKDVAAPYSISISQKEFVKEYSKGGLSSRPISIAVDNSKEGVLCIIKEIQVHPVTDNPMHIDFYHVQRGVETEIAIYVKILNKNVSPGLKRGGTLNVVQRKIPIICCPENIPNAIEVDISSLEIGQVLHINDITLPSNVRCADQSNFSVVSISGRVSADNSADAGNTEAEADSTNEA